jgi:hypothetical protein
VATLCIFLAVYLLYSLRIVKVTSRLATGVIAATGGRQSMKEVTRSAKALPIALPKGCRGQMSEERPATRQGFYSRLFSRDDGRGRVGG